ncbi:MAG: hypothetical protein E7C49_00990 [Clostridium sp.]|nr:hypothetical protein [Clostridium sp.]
MIREIDINFTTIIDLLSKILEDKRIYLKAKNIDLQHLNNKYILIADLIKELSIEKYKCIYYRSDDKIYKKKIKQLYILLQDIKYKYNKVKTIIEEPNKKEEDIISLVEISDILFSSNIECEYSEIICEKLKNSIYEIRDYFWINNFINGIKESNIINNYLKYKRINNIERFEYIKGDISYEDIDRVQYKIDCLLNNKYALMPPIYVNNFSDNFITSNFSLDINDSDLLKSILDMTIDSTEAVKIKWYHYLNRKKLKQVKNYNEKILTEQKTMRKIIFEQYKENIDSLKMYVKSFEFLQSVITENYFNKIYNYIYDENEMYIFLKSLSNNLYLFKELITITNVINNLSDKERELLDLCYDKYDTISKYKEKLYSLPTMVLINNFKRYKENYKKSNVKKENLDNLIDDLNNDLSILNLFSSTNFNSFSALITVNDITPIDDKSSNEVYILNNFEYDDCIHYIDESLDNKVENLEIEVDNYDIVKFIKGTIANLGYKIIQNYKFELINLEIAVVNPKDPNKIVYIFIDCFQINSYCTIRKLSYIKKKNIPIIYCWSDDFLINRNIEVLKLKTTLRTLLS